MTKTKKAAVSVLEKNAVSDALSGNINNPGGVSQAEFLHSVQNTDFGRNTNFGHVKNSTDILRELHNAKNWNLIVSIILKAAAIQEAPDNIRSFLHIHGGKRKPAGLYQRT